MTTLAPANPRPTRPTARDAAWDVVSLAGGAAASGRADVLIASAALNASVKGLVEPGARLHHLFDRACTRMGRAQARRRLAVDYGEVGYTYAELQTLANRLAHYLAEVGVRFGDRVGLLLDRTIGSHASVLALSKLGATWVPLDAGFPDDRIAHMLDDACVVTVITLTRFTHRFARRSVDVIELDAVQHLIARCPATPPKPMAEHGVRRRHRGEDPVCYIIYTSGSTGRPKGVPVRHSSICNFVAVAAEMYGYEPSDRVYQGMTTAFDFSVEELWVPLAVGATLVPAPGGVQLVGPDLAEFIAENRITALCCVPTLLATLEADRVGLRFLLVSGEACPADVIEPWLTPDRRVLNAYGPTETTVTATWSVVQPGRPITIGGPLPTYSVVILDADGDEPLPAGSVGEIGIGGLGVADGYLNQPERTARAFMADTIGLPDNPEGRIYRTGDLGRINADDEIEFLGRIDTQVKIRGYRIELDEIAAVARAVGTVGQAVVDTWEQDGGGTELVAYLTRSEPDRPIEFDEVQQALVDALPSYMVPAWYTELDELPLLPSTKVDRAALPGPTGPRHRGGAGALVLPHTEAEASVARILADVLRVEAVSVEADFFEDLGADSLRLAELATVIRAELGVKRLSMRKLYENPTVAQVAALVDPDSPALVDHAGSSSGSALLVETSPSTDATRSAAVKPPQSPEPTGKSRGPTSRRSSIAEALAHLLTAAAQLVVFLATTYAAALAGVAAVGWVDGARNMPEAYGRAVLAGSGLWFGGGFALVGVKWLAVGRLRAESIPLWSPPYVRFWVARSAVRINPFNLLVGSPLYNVYLRSLGMGVGRGAVILIAPPACPDLVSVGEGSVIREECLLPGYRAEVGRICPGPVRIGARVVIGEASVLDIRTEIGDGAAIGSVSCVPIGAEVPAGAVMQGSPVQPSSVTVDRVAPRSVGHARRAWFTVTQLASLVLVTAPMGLLGAWLVAAAGGSVGAATPLTGPLGGLADLMVAGWAIYLAGLAASGFVTVVVPRVLHCFIRTGSAQPLYGTQWRLARAVQRYSNNVVLNTIFGDSSMIVGYLKAVGYDLSRSTQTGSNFGVDQRHHNPFLVSFDRNTLVSDGLRLLNTEVSATSFEVQPITMPPDTYLGNDVRYPAGSRVGEGCLIATKAAVPTEGPVRANVGLLGSPAFEIPRSVARDHRFDHFKQPGVLEKRLRLKLRSNLVTAALYLLRSWLLVVWTMVITIGCFAVIANDPAALAVAAAVTLWTNAVLAIAIERVARAFRPLEPLYCSLYDRRFWEHERFWKLNYNALLRAFDGTPFKPVLLRMQGAQVGRRVFDDGGGLTEPTLVRLGDEAVLNARSTIQCHSLEDGTFKSDRTELGAGVMLGVGAFVHYGVVVGERATIDADSFVMKGTTIPASCTWRGNPARDIDDDTPSEPNRGDVP